MIKKNTDAWRHNMTGTNPAPDFISLVHRLNGGPVSQLRCTSASRCKTARWWDTDRGALVAVDVVDDCDQIQKLRWKYISFNPSHIISQTVKSNLMALEIGKLARRIFVGFALLVSVEAVSITIPLTSRKPTFIWKAVEYFLLIP